jgi:hypothetical protein
MRDKNGRRRYDFAFRVGSVGAIILGVISLTSGSLAAFSALALWSYATMLLLPKVYDWLNAV